VAVRKAVNDGPRVDAILFLSHRAA
jgi:hypothetical protein